MGLLLKSHLIILKHMPTNHNASLHIRVGLNPTWANLMQESVSVRMLKIGGFLQIPRFPPQP